MLISGPGKPHDNHNMDTKPPSLIFTLSDGRQIGYIDYTSHGLLSSAPTILYCHGFPGSRLEGAIAAPCAREYGARLIAIDRPGIGLSTFQPGRSLTDWPKDVEELVNYLKIEKFFLLGVSGGSPYVIACAHLIPRHRILGAAIVSGLYPFNLGTEGIPVGARMMIGAAASRWMWLSGCVSPLLDWYTGKVARDYDHPERLEHQFMREMGGKHEKDIKCLDDPVLRKQVIDPLREAFRQGSDGVAWEARLYGSEWGFNLEEVEFEGLAIWHGRLDTNVPIITAEKAARLLKGVELRVFEDESHLSLPVNHLADIMGSFLGEHSTKGL